MFLRTSRRCALRIQVTGRVQSAVPAIANHQCRGGGEGIRTPDPMVANHVLCQLSYTPDKTEARDQMLDVRTNI